MGARKAGHRILALIAPGVVVLLTILGCAEAAPQLALLLDGLDQPLYLTHSHDGTGRLFILEQPGRVKVLVPGEGGPRLFLDIADRVLSGGERGLLGLAFHPQFPANPRFFVHYTRRPDGASVIAEYRVATGNANLADPTETVLLVVSQPFANHNGGMIEFGPDGFLYIGLGDGGAANDPGRRAQDVTSLLGKILRIDVDHPASATQRYSSPADNPFAGATAGLDEIYAFGFRNPWRFSFDRRTGELYVGDVGQGSFEEVDLVVKGGNYGWRVFEGNHCTGLDPNLCSVGGFVPPVTEYDHSGGRCSITGGYVYRGHASTLPVGGYVFGDFCGGEIFLWKDGVTSVLAGTTLAIASFGEDEQGEIYVVDIEGAVYRIVDPDAPVLSVQLNQTAFRPGDTLRVTIGLRSGRPPFSADLYAGFLVPGGPGTAFFLTRLAPLAGVTTSLDADARMFPPLARGLLIPGPVDVAVGDFVTFVFTGGEPVGPYVLFVALTAPGALDDGHVDPGDFLAIAAATLTAAPAAGMLHSRLGPR